MNLKKIEEEALHLPVRDRAQLARKLLLSLEEPSSGELEEDWAKEAQRRAKEIDDGEVQTVPAEEVLRKARALLK
jgi:putative addiction module component (TIGR02574 family)